MDRQPHAPMDQGESADKSHSATSLDTKLASIDLNLLIALDALLVYRNVTHAARRIGQTQPAMSRALARLRDLLGDDLLVRSSTGLKLTARGEYLAGIVPAAMSHVRDVISSRELSTEVRVSIDANLMPALFPHLLQSVTRENQLLKVDTHRSPQEGMAKLRSHSALFMLGRVLETGAEIRSEIVIAEDFVTLVAGERHNLGGTRPPIDAFLDLTHINLAHDGEEFFPQFAEALISCGIRRSRFLEVSDVTSAALIVAESRLALTVPRSIAGWLMKTMPLAALHPPISIPNHEIAISWLADLNDVTGRRLIDEIVVATREAIAHDQASIRVLRLVPPKA
ncbi:LysR family transcriptional regulator [Mesorhizobium sp. GbtcB19]|uniref:LysR family transcriptional regulator n=1 Tax=Mesorhizobium sp. GbtcB19 TaxID=2824764 RepID=UPI001C2F20B7|nr:LysR family transcriptional regulator [Mesorhizobium sp. GbtcB19]